MPVSRASRCSEASRLCMLLELLWLPAASGAQGRACMLPAEGLSPSLRFLMSASSALVPARLWVAGVAAIGGSLPRTASGEGER